MSELARLTLQLRRLDSLLFRSNQALQQEVEDVAMAVNVQGLEAMRRSLKGRFNVLAAKEWLDVCKYQFKPVNDLFIPINQMVDALGGFQHAVGVTADAIRQGRPKDRGNVSKTAATESALRFAYTEGGDGYGEFGVTMLVEHKRELIEPVEESVRTIFDIAESTDTDQIHAYSQRLGAAPIRALSEWSASHARAGLESSIQWVRDAEHTKSLNKTPVEWQALKKTIEMVSDSLTEEIKLRGILIAANIKTQAFVIEGPNKDLVSGKFAEGVVSRDRAAHVPRDYEFTLQKTTRRNYATDRVSTDYRLVSLDPVS